jgi:hypothetical protein
MTAVLALAAAPSLLACNGAGASTVTTSGPPVKGQTSFVSTVPGGSHGSGGSKSAGADAGTATSAPSAAGTGAGLSNGAGGAASTTPARTVQETDLYRLEGNRLYYLNSYRGLLVFDVTNVDQPKLLGRSAIFGTPVDMIVNNGIATVIVGDWYGKLDDGSPFHGSIVRGLDATDPTNIKVLGDAKLGGDIQDSRVVGNILYAVSEDYGWEYGWDSNVYYGGGVGVAYGYGGDTADVIVSSVDFSNGQVKQVSSKRYAGYGGVFNVTANSIMLAHQAAPSTDGGAPPSQTVLQYLDISDPAGAIVERGTLTVDGTVNSWGADNGRWTLDFADGQTAHVIGCAGSSYGCSGDGYVLSTVDFSNPDAPALDSALNIPDTGWSLTARFDSHRMYLAPGSNYYYGSNSATTPLEVYDLSNPAKPALAGSTQIPGQAWLIMPSGNQLFELGQTDSADSSQVAVTYLDVTNAANPTVIGTSTFGNGWAWTPAADTFKAFTMDPSKGLVLIPFSGWDASNQGYNNGVQLIEFTPTSIKTGGAAHTHGWVERGIFVNNRIVSLSDLSLAVVDYTDPLNPAVTAELTLARNVIAAQPNGNTIAEVSSDWWGNDTTTSQVRVLPTSDADENSDESGAPQVNIDGVNANVFTNGNLDYIVTTLQVPGPCPNYGYAQPQPGICTVSQEQVQVVDLSSGTATLRGKVALPIDSNGYYYGFGWDGGYYWYDWYDGAEAVQVGTDALAFRRWSYSYDPQGNWDDARSDLLVVDLSNPDAPTVSSTIITHDSTAWWGDMQVVGGTLYTMHYDWEDYTGENQTVRYYLDRIDLSDRAHPRIESKVNVPGILVGASATDPSLLYFSNYYWDNSNNAVNTFDVARIQGNTAYLQGSLTLDGWAGNVFVQGNTAYTSVQVYSNDPNNYQSWVELHQIDITDPTHPVDYISTDKKGWGWLLSVNGDRALVSSGWGDNGIDVYKLTPNAVPVYDQFLRTNGWGVNAASRQGDQIFLSSGYWGVETFTLR